MIIGDVLDGHAVGRAMRDVDVIYNFAGIADIEEALKNPIEIETVKYNILGNTFCWRLP